MDTTNKIYVAGHNGLVGSALVKELKALGYLNIICKSHSELDLINQNAVEEFFEKEKPEYVFLAAAKVGGIFANNEYPAEFIYKNLMIEANIIHNAYKHKVKRLLFLGSSCIYPKLAPQPIKESSLLTGELESTNEPYAIAKITGIKLCESYNRQYDTDFRSAMPTNLYGENDNFHPKNSHVIPALIRRFHQAKIDNAKEVIVWGTGKAQREFLFSEDLAKACIYLMKIEKTEYKSKVSARLSHINIGTGEDITIKELVGFIKNTTGYKGKISWDTSMPDGTLRKVMDVSKINSMGWKASTTLESGLKYSYKGFLSTIEKSK
jgi:GDP-L-fucose synthase